MVGARGQECIDDKLLVVGLGIADGDDGAGLTVLAFSSVFFDLLSISFSTTDTHDRHP